MSSILQFETKDAAKGCSDLTPFSVVQLTEEIVFECRVIGTPEPQGSTKAFVPRGWKRAVITSDNKKLKPWRATMSSAFVEKLTGMMTPAFSGPVVVVAMFVFERTKTWPKKGKPHIVKPDLDKLLRGLGDSLSESQVLNDDNLIVMWSASKRYATEGECPGVHVVVRRAV